MARQARDKQALVIQEGPVTGPAMMGAVMGSVLVLPVQET
jgi:hypothetical protein